MAAKLYPPYINGTLPAFWLDYDASNVAITGAQITIPFTDNPAVSNNVSGFSLRLRTASTGSYLFEPVFASQADKEKNNVTFILTASQAKKLKEGQYYKIQIAYCGGSQEDVGYYSTVGIIKCTSKPTISIANLSLENINFFTNDFVGLYDLSQCKDQTEKVYSYSFQMFDENGNIYYDTGELLHNASYDTEYAYSIDRVSINEFVSQNKAFSIQYNVTTLNGLQLSTGQYRLTNEGFSTLSRNIKIIPQSNLDNGYITINFEGELDKDRSLYYILNEDNLISELDINNNYIIDNNGKTIIQKIMNNNSSLSYIKDYNFYRYYENGLINNFRYVKQKNNLESIIINGNIYYCDKEVYDANEWLQSIDNNNEYSEDEINTLPLYLLIADGTDLIKAISYSYVEDHNYYLDESKTHLINGLGSFYYVLSQSPYKAFYYGAYLLSRASDEDNYSTWINIERFRLEEEPPSSHSVKDFTIEHGRKYIYALQQYNIWGLYSSRIVSDIYQAGFEDAFLYDGDRVLKIKFNPEVSNFKTTILEQKTDTLGGRFPYITRNGETYYKEFPIGGLIAAEMDEEELFINRGLVTSHRKATPAIEAYEPENALRDYHMFSDENIMLERQFKLEVLNWLNDGQPKLFKSPYEGNYIVRLMNTSLTPVKELGRMLHSFTTTAYEIAECTYDNLVKYGFIKINTPSDFVGLWKTYNLADYATGTDIEIPFEGGVQSFAVQDMMPGDIIEIIYATGEPASEDIMIGITGAYMCGGIDRPISKLKIHPRHLIPEFGDNNQQKMTGTINCYYKGARITGFDAVTGVQLRTIPSQQFIGVDPSLESIKREDWTTKNNGGAFEQALHESQYMSFYGYTIRDYIDKIVEKTYNSSNGRQYFVSDEGQKYINAFDPGDVIARINATINLGESSKIELLKIEQGHFRLRELVPVYVQRSSTNNNTTQEALSVSVSPFGYPHPIEELIDFEMIDPFCVFEVFQLKDGYWQPLIGDYGSPYYDPYYKKWLYDYEPYFQMNYQVKKISYVTSTDPATKPYKRSDLTLIIDSKTGEKQYKYQNQLISESRIYDIEIQRESIDGKMKYYYIDNRPNFNMKIYLDKHNFYEEVSECTRGVFSETPKENAIYQIKQYDNQIDLSIVKEKEYKDFENINGIRIGTGVMAELTFQIKVIDYYTEINNKEVAAAKAQYLDRSKFYRNIMKTYAVIDTAYQKSKKYMALTSLYMRLLYGKNDSNLADMSDEENEIINQLLSNTKDMEDLNLLTIYNAITINNNLVTSDMLELAIDYIKETKLKSVLMEKPDMDQVMTFLDNFIFYYNSFNTYFLVDLNTDVFLINEINHPIENGVITLEDVYNYNYYSYIDWDTRTQQLYFVKKDIIETYCITHPEVIKQYVAVDINGIIIPNINSYNIAIIELLSQVEDSKIYNKNLLALTNQEYQEYKAQDMCVWIYTAGDTTSLHEYNSIQKILTPNTTTESLENKLKIIQEEIDDFNNQINESQNSSINIDAEYAEVYNALIEALNNYNSSIYFLWCVNHLKEILRKEPKEISSLQALENYLNKVIINLVSYNDLLNSSAMGIKVFITEELFALQSDFDKIAIYSKIMDDKTDDENLDEYHRQQILLSYGRVLKGAYEAYFCGQKILQLIYSFGNYCNEKTLLFLLNTYKEIYQLFQSTFELCLNEDNEILQYYIDGLVVYYNLLLTDTRNLMANMQSNWESSQNVDEDQYLELMLKSDELYFIHFILTDNQTKEYNRRSPVFNNDPKYCLSPLLRSANDQQNLVYKINQTSLFDVPITSYVDKDYHIQQNNIVEYTINNLWMYTRIENSSKTYYQILAEDSDILSSIAFLQGQQCYYLYFQAPQRTMRITDLNNTDDSFIFNPLADHSYKKIAKKLSCNNYTQYYILDHNQYSPVLETLTEFAPNTEYYVQTNVQGYYISVDNTVTKESLETLSGYNDYERKDGKLLIFYYDITDDSYKALEENETLQLDTTYYLGKAIPNFEYYSNLDQLQKDFVLNISYKSNIMLNDLVDNLIASYAGYNNIMIINYALSQEEQLKKIQEKLSILNKADAFNAFQEALNNYNTVISTYQQELKATEITPNGKNKYQLKLDFYNSHFSTNFVQQEILEETGELIEKIYTLSYDMTPKNINDNYRYFYNNEDPVINELNIVQETDNEYNSLFILNQDLITFFSGHENTLTDPDGVVNWYKELVINQKLKYYQVLLNEAIGLQALYQKLYDNYLNKYSDYDTQVKESGEIYSSYQETEELDYYLNNKSNQFEDLRLEVKKAWWNFLNLLDEKYTEEKARGMYV